MSDEAITESKFWDRVVKSEGCWQWSGRRNSDGYGELRVGSRYKRAHRLSWELHVGAIGDGLGVLHLCDNPSCVRPDHLFLGTPADNAADRSSKGRNGSAPGERHGLAKLTERAVVEIRSRRSSGESIRSLAKRFGVGFHTIFRVIHGQTWKHVSGPVTP